MHLKRHTTEYKTFSKLHYSQHHRSSHREIFWNTQTVIALRSNMQEEIIIIIQKCIANSWNVSSIDYTTSRDI